MTDQLHVSMDDGHGIGIRFVDQGSHVQVSIIDTTNEIFGGVHMTMKMPKKGYVKRMGMALMAGDYYRRLLKYLLRGIRDGIKGHKPCAKPRKQRINIVPRSITDPAPRKVIYPKHASPSNRALRLVK